MFCSSSNKWGIHLNKTLRYIAENTHEKDIVCDIVVGRASLATGEFPCIDMRKQGTIYHPNKRVRMDCIPCRFAADQDGQIRLTLKRERERQNL